MARLTSAHRFLDGCEPLSADDADDLPAVPGFRPGATRADSDVATPAPPPSLLQRHRGLVSTLIGAGLAVGLFGLLVHDVYGYREPAGFSCPPAISGAVQAATGCQLAPGDDDEE